jgi:hypothetical protein
MLDVHPPTHPTHTWRDFLIHIATIVVGLLIAIGLEQTVELIHHSHQRHELEENLHIDNELNRDWANQDLDSAQKIREWAMGQAYNPHRPNRFAELRRVSCRPGQRSN